MTGGGLGASASAIGGHAVGPLDLEFSARTAVPEWNGETVLIPMEDDAYLTEKGYVYFRPYQTEWYLIR